MKNIFNIFNTLVFLSILSLNGISYSQSGWVQQNSGTTNSLNSIFFINENTGWAAGAAGTIVKTVNGGSTWNLQTTNTHRDLLGIIFIDENQGMAVGTYFDGNPWCIYSQIILTTSNGGQSWNIISDGLASRIHDFSSYHNSIYIAYEGSDLQCIQSTGSITNTTNLGLNWNSYLPLSLNNFGYYSVHFIDEMTGWAAGHFTDDCCNNDRHIVRSTDGGSSWNIMYLDTAQGLSFPYPNTKLRFTDPNTGYLTARLNYSEEHSLLKTTDAGVTWNHTNYAMTANKKNFTFINSDIGWCIGTAGSVIATDDGGSTWEIQNSGTGANLHSITFLNNYIGYISGTGGVILKTVTGGFTSINISSLTVNDYQLHQNYPNPFNPVTKIKFDVQSNLNDRSSNVKLTVYDALGKEVMNLINGSIRPGSYEVEFNGEGLQSGIYFYKLQAGNYSATMKMILLK